MPPKKTAEEKHPGAGKSVSVTPKSRDEWAKLLRAAATEHWRTLRVEIRLLGKMLAGKPRRLDIAEAMIKARGLGDTLKTEVVEDPVEREAMATEAADESICEFHRRDGRPGIWLPANNVKAMLKENWSVLGYGMKMRGSKGALAEGVFVYSKAAPGPGETMEDLDWIFLGDAPDGIDEGVVHAVTMQGPRSSLKRNEYVSGKTLTFFVNIAVNVKDKLDDEAFAKVLFHAGNHGLGAGRSQGNGKFEILAVEDVSNELGSAIKAA